MSSTVASDSIGQNETISSLRRVCDRHFHKRAIGHVFERGQGLPRDLIREIVASLPNGVFDRVTLAAGRADSHNLTVRVSPLFYCYVAATAEYCLSLTHDNAPLKEATVHAKAVAD